MSESKLQRVNIRVSNEVHKFFLNRSEQTGVSMSALMFLALEQYMQQQQTMKNVPEFIQALNEIESKKEQIKQLIGVDR